MELQAGMQIMVRSSGTRHASIVRITAKRILVTYDTTRRQGVQRWYRLQDECSAADFIANVWTGHNTWCRCKCAACVKISDNLLIDTIATRHGIDVSESTPMKRQFCRTCLKTTTDYYTTVTHVDTTDSLTLNPSTRRVVHTCGNCVSAAAPKPSVPSLTSSRGIDYRGVTYLGARKAERVAMWNAANLETRGIYLAAEIRRDREEQEAYRIEADSVASNVETSHNRQIADACSVLPFPCDETPVTYLACCGGLVCAKHAREAAELACPLCASVMSAPLAAYDAAEAARNAAQIAAAGQDTAPARPVRLDSYGVSRTPSYAAFRFGVEVEFWDDRAVRAIIGNFATWEEAVTEMQRIKYSDRFEYVHGVVRLYASVDNV